jgi:hypothetical protein
MKYAIANQKRIVYTTRDTSDGFSVEKARAGGELCIEIKEHHDVIAPHYIHDEATDTFYPRPVDAELLEEFEGLFVEEEKKEPLLRSAGLRAQAAKAKHYYDCTSMGGTSRGA